MTPKLDYSQQGKNWTLPEEGKDQQSPIDLPKLSAIEFEPKFHIKLDYPPLSGVALQDQGHSLKLTSDKIGTVEITDLNGKGPYTFKAE